jgi:hypothetical protein
MRPSRGSAVVDTSRPIRAGILVLPLGAALKLIGNLGTFNSVGYGVPQLTEAAAVTSPDSYSANSSAEFCQCCSRRQVLFLGDRDER